MLARRSDIVPSHQAPEGAPAERAVRSDDSIDELPSMASDAAGSGFAGAPGQTRGAGAALCFSGSPQRVPPKKAVRVPGEPGPTPIAGDPTPSTGALTMESQTDTPPTVPFEDPTGAYTRWAGLFQRALADTNSVPLALAICDTIRHREERRLQLLADEDPKRVVRVCATLFYVPVARVFERNRHADVTSARYVAAWILRRWHWSLHKIARFFSLDHSTIVHGLRKVDTNAHLLFAAHKAEKLLELDPAGC